MHGNTAAAVIVTYNRKQMLMKTIDAILAQSKSVNRIIIVDNASTDGTNDLLKEGGYLSNPLVKYIRMPENTGGAGGFYEGLKNARETDACFYWIMDDDVIPENGSLEKLLSAQAWIEKQSLIIPNMRKTAFLASAIYGPNGEYMNLPLLSDRKAENGYEYWYRFLENGIVNIKAATFVSVLINAEAVKKCGLPCKDYFIWGDDFEYTQRLHKYYGDGYFVGNSRAVHNRANAKNLNIENEKDPSRIKMYHYFYRNNAINDKLYKGKRIFPEFVKTSIRFLTMLPNKEKRCQCLTKLIGYKEALTYYQHVNKYVQGQIKT